MSKTKQENRRLGRRLVKYADGDRWDKCLAIQKGRKRQVAQQGPSSDEPLVWMGATTEAGDGLVHLAAFAACDTSMSLVDRRRALQSLVLTLEADIFAVNRSAGDGGTALHAALASASSSSFIETNVDKDKEDEQGSDAESTSGSESSDDCQRSLGWNDISEADGMDTDCTSDQLIFEAVQVLLDAGADPNLPLNPAMQSYGDVEEDVELTYAQEAVDEQWTPLTMALQWVLLSTVNANETDVNGQTMSSLEGSHNHLLSMNILEMLLKGGGTPSYPYGSNVKWDAFEFLASFPSLVHSTSDSDDKPPVMEDYVEKLLLQYSDIPSLPLSELQSFASAMISNDSHTASQIFASQKYDARQVMSMTFSNILPMPQAFWGASQNRFNWTLLETCAAARANQSVHFAMTTHPSYCLSQKEATNAIAALFSNRATARSSQLRNSSSALEEICKNLVESVAVPTRAESDKEMIKQKFLDRLLLQACGGNWGSPHSIRLLLTLGADGNAESVHSTVRDGLRPLHFVAANYRGKDGILMVNELLTSGASAAVSSSRDESPLNIALEKRNFLVAGRLWDETNESSVVLTKNEDQNKKTVFTLGEAAIACQSIPMLKDAVASIHYDNDSNTSPESTCEQSQLLGKLLLLCVDERSGFGKNRHVPQLVRAVRVILDNDHKLSVLPSFELDSISKHNPIHLILRRDRGKELRSALLPLLCNHARANDMKDPHVISDMRTINRVSFQCDAKFGGYSALSMACALGCESSIRTLIEHNADINMTDSLGKKPRELLRDPSNLPSDLRVALGIEN